jgi:hypothetical protein
MKRRLVGMLLALALATGRAAAQAPAEGPDLPPVGFGRLNQEQLSVQFSSGDNQVRFLPLDERVLRLLANDGYASLHALVDSRRAALDSAAAAAGLSSPGLVMVSFFGLRDDARFDPENLGLFYRSQFYRPEAIVPLSANFSNRQLPVRRAASAIYIFELPIPVYDEFDVAYGSAQSSGWKDILSRLDRERAWVTSRAQAARQDTAATKP